MLKQQGGKCTYLRTKPPRRPSALLLSQELQLVCKLWAGKPLHQRYAKLPLPFTAPERDRQCSQWPGQLAPSDPHPNSRRDSDICSNNSLLDKSVCRWRVTHRTHTAHTMDTRNPLGAWLRTEQCPRRLLGTESPTATSWVRDASPPPRETPGPAGEQNPEKPRSTCLGGRREVHTYQS